MGLVVVSWLYMGLVVVSWLYLVLVVVSWLYLVLVVVSWLYLVLVLVSWYQLVLPGGADRAGQQGPFLLRSELHDARGLKLLADPLALLQVIDEHELHADVLAVCHLGDTHIEPVNYTSFIK